jgi:protocatechuate 4,5-dioxygenase beta chain/2'-aminobiphenyl-2,3-diol 1,2-dioxygenase large subunit
MGEIVGAFATSHVLMSPEGIEDKADRVFRGMKEIGRRAVALRPDVLLYVASDHANNFRLELQVPFTVGVSDRYEPLGDMGLPKDSIAGHREFAEGLVAYALENGFDLAKAEEVRPDHGVALPNLFVNRDGRIPIVPIFVNTGMRPGPAPGRCWALGQTVRSFVERTRPRGERVVVYGTGGLSHWICMDRQGEVNERFDRLVIDRIVAGRAEELAALSWADVLAEAGNGGLEILAWIVAAAAMSGGRAEKIYYEAIPQWLTGMGGVAIGDRASAEP